MAERLQQDRIIREQRTEGPKGETVVNQTHVMDLPQGQARFQTEAVLNTEVITLLDNCGLTKSTPHVEIESDLIGGSVSVLMRGGRGTVPLEDGALHIDASNLTTKLAAEQKREREKEAATSWASRGDVWGGRSMRPLYPSGAKSEF